MPDMFYQYLAVFGLVFLINLVPAFMPASWMVLVFFRVRYGLLLLALGIGGAFCSAAGRLLLARGSRLFAERFLTSEESDLRKLGAFLNDHREHVGVATFLYTLSPLPSNNLFIAAGIVQIELLWVVLGFLGGRMIADLFWVWLTARVFHSLSQVFIDTFRSWLGITLQVASFAGIVVLFRLPWARWLRRRLQDRTSNP